MDTGLDLIGPGNDIYVYSATIPDTTLVAGSYLLSIVNNTSLDTNDSWFWAASDQSGTFWSRQIDGEPWIAFGTGGNRAFNISSPAGVPETGTSALLLGVGFIAI